MGEKAFQYRAPILSTAIIIGATMAVACTLPSPPLSNDSNIHPPLKATSSTPAFPLKSSSNNRYLVDQNNVPFMINGDSPHRLVTSLSTSDMNTYMSNRASHGMNATIVDVLCTMQCAPSTLRECVDQTTTRTLLGPRKERVSRHSIVCSLSRILG
jgi:Protein of unknown function (DUF4038)